MAAEQGSKHENTHPLRSPRGMKPNVPDDFSSDAGNSTAKFAKNAKGKLRMFCRESHLRPRALYGCRDLCGSEPRHRAYTFSIDPYLV
jgi:hypothetical protein